MNEQLHHQSEQLNRVGETVEDIQKDSWRASNILKTIQWSLFKEKVCLYATMVSLLVIDVVVAIIFFGGCPDDDGD